MSGDDMKMVDTAELWEVWWTWLVMVLVGKVGRDVGFCCDRWSSDRGWARVAAMTRSVGMIFFLLFFLPSAQEL